MTSSLILELEHVSKEFDDGFEVVNDVSIKVKRGEFVCFIGPSGCGKTVLLYEIAGFYPAHDGNIKVDGKVSHFIGQDRIMVFQDHMLFPWKTVFQNLMFGMKKSPLPKLEKIELVEKYLKSVDLLKFRDWPIYKLSGGMKQRVALGRSLLANPEILLMDEPFSSLDAITRKNLRKKLINLWQETQKTILFVTHSVSEAVYLADTIYLMSARPTTVKKTYNIDLPRPREITNPNFVKIMTQLEADLERECEFDKNRVDEQIELKDILIN
jgi:ABC-type nitrate/sulfonate/bicarbonate transport system ATPase subunit